MILELLICLSLILIFILSIILLAIHWRILSKFYHSRYSFFDILFYGLFFIEEIILIILLYSGDEINTLRLIASLSALAVILTATVEKFLLNQKHMVVSKVKDDYVDLSEDLYELNEEVSDENDILRKENSKLISFIRRNISKIF